MSYTHASRRPPNPLENMQAQIDALTRALTAMGNDMRTLRRDLDAKTAITQTSETVTITTSNRHVDAGPARSHLINLTSNGVTKKAIADASGVSRPNISSIANGRHARITPTTEALILAVQPKEQS